MLTVPLDEMDVPKYYGQHILKLFVTAQQMGTVVAYPSGVLHEYQNGKYQRHMFLTITGDAPAAPPQARLSAPSAKVTLPAAESLPM